jgi:monoterpene epsilon-lactone hydrolase
MSLRAELVRLGLRWFVKRKIGPATTLEALRRQDAFLERLVPPPPKGTQATHVDLNGVKGVAVVTPASLSGRLVLYLHGGGHVSGSPALSGDFTWRIAAATRARTVILDHRLAPEHPFPAALDDAVTAYRALLTDGADPRRMAVLGESSGGGLVGSPPANMPNPAEILTLGELRLRNVAAQTRIISVTRIRLNQKNLCGFSKR